MRAVSRGVAAAAGPSSGADPASRLRAAIGPRKLRDGVMNEESRLREFASQYAAAWCSRHLIAVAEFFAPEGSLTVNGGTPAVGRATIASEARAFGTAFPDMRVTFDRLVLLGEREWNFTGPWRATIPGRVHRETRANQRIRGLDDRARWVDCGSQGYFDAHDIGARSSLAQARTRQRNRALSAPARGNLLNC
jgi:hypothetical protein